MRPAVDVARILIISMAGLTIGLAAYIGVVYLRTYVDLPVEYRRWGPLEVVGIAISHVMYTVFATLVITDFIGHPDVTWETPYLAVAMVLSFGVLVFTARKERRRWAAWRAAKAAGHPLRRATDP